MKSTDGAYLFPSPAGEPSAVLGARAGRTSNRETVEAVDRLLSQMLDAHRFTVCFHTCQGYTVALARFEVCDTCGWGPGFPFPALRDAVTAALSVLGADDARAWFLAGAELLGWDE